MIFIHALPSIIVVIEREVGKDGAGRDSQEKDGERGRKKQKGIFALFFLPAV